MPFALTSQQLSRKLARELMGWQSKHTDAHPNVLLWFDSQENIVDVVAHWNPCVDYIAAHQVQKKASTLNPEAYVNELATIVSAERDFIYMPDRGIEDYMSLDEGVVVMLNAHPRQICEAAYLSITRTVADPRESR